MRRVLLTLTLLSFSTFLCRKNKEEPIPIRCPTELKLPDAKYFYCEWIPDSFSGITDHDTLFQHFEKADPHSYLTPVWPIYYIKETDVLKHYYYRILNLETGHYFSNYKLFGTLSYQDFKDKVRLTVDHPIPDVAATYSIEFYELKPSFSYIEGLRKGSNDGIVLGREEEFCGFAAKYDTDRISLFAAQLQHFKKGYFRGIKEDYTWGYELNIRYRNKRNYSHYINPCPRDRDQLMVDTRNLWWLESGGWHSFSGWSKIPTLPNYLTETELIEYTLTRARDPVTVRVRGVGGPDFSKPFTLSDFQQRFSLISRPSWATYHTGALYPGTDKPVRWYEGYFRYKNRVLNLKIFDKWHGYLRLSYMKVYSMQKLLRTMYNTPGLNELTISSTQRPASSSPIHATGKYWDIVYLNTTLVNNGNSKSTPEPLIYKSFFTSHFNTPGALQFLGPWRQRSHGINFQWDDIITSIGIHSTDKNHWHHLHIGYNP